MLYPTQWGNFKFFYPSWAPYFNQKLVYFDFKRCNRYSRKRRNSFLPNNSTTWRLRTLKFCFRPPFLNTSGSAPNPDLKSKYLMLSSLNAKDEQLAQSEAEMSWKFSAFFGSRLNQFFFSISLKRSSLETLSCFATCLQIWLFYLEEPKY